ncbi:hypothetical protein JST97_37170 [bacterium]|nr:hypothetical protein [bacterium]
MATITSMVGDGFYDRHSHVQAQFILSSADQLERAASSVSLPEQGPVGLADLGSSEGKNSLVLMGHLVEMLRRRRAEQSFLIIHNDLPANNFNGLFQKLYAQGKPYGPDSWVMASAASFYEPISPPQTLHIVCCYSAVHWLSHVPKIPNPSGVLFARMDAKSRAILAAQAARDWEAFLRARAQEMVPGGQLIIVTGGREGEDVAGIKMYRLLDQILKELSHPPFVMPIYYRSREEIVAPLDACGFKCEHFRIQSLSTPFAEQLAINGDRIAYARATTSFVRAWMEPLLPDPRIYEMMEERMAEDPEGTGVDNVQVIAAFSRL